MCNRVMIYTFSSLSRFVDSKRGERIEFLSAHTSPRTTAGFNHELKPVCLRNQYVPALGSLECGSWPPRSFTPIGCLDRNVQCSWLSTRDYPVISLASSDGKMQVPFMDWLEPFWGEKICTLCKYYDQWAVSGAYPLELDAKLDLLNVVSLLLII
jgi:hypothetical protein